MSVSSTLLAHTKGAGNGVEIASFEVSVPKFILGQLGKHRQLSMNFESSRAKPFWKVLEQVAYRPYIPRRFGTYGSGMQPQGYYTSATHALWDYAWCVTARETAASAMRFAYMGNAPVDSWEDIVDAIDNRTFDFSVLKDHPPKVAKELINRLLEPFMMVSGIITATQWENFFRLRTAPDAQDAINELAKSMKRQLEASTPVVSDTHTPYTGDVVNVVSRIARVSYGTHNQESRRPADELFQQLLAGGHWSPFEHVAFESDEDVPGNFVGWRQLRHVYDTNSY